MYKKKRIFFYLFKFFSYEKAKKSVAKMKDDKKVKRQKRFLLFCLHLL